MYEDERLRVGTELIHLGGMLAYAGRVVADGDEAWRYKGFGTMWEVAFALLELQHKYYCEYIKGMREAECEMNEFEEYFGL